MAQQYFAMLAEGYAAPILGATQMEILQVLDFKIRKNIEVVLFIFYIVEIFLKL